MASVYRKAAFMAVGLSSFTQQAFQKAQRHFTDDLSHVSLTGRSVAITGANSGIGMEVARAVLQRGGTVHMICRDRERGEKARQELLTTPSTHSPPAVELHVVDLSSIGQTKAFCRAFVASHRPLHVLVNNAGGMTHKRTLTPEGLESNFATNVAGVFALTEGLLPVLRASNSPAYVSRVVTVSSGGMLSQDLTVDDLQAEKTADGDATYIYAQNKRQQVALTEVWQRREDEARAAGPAPASTPCVVFHSMHPGWADTPAVRTAMPDFFKTLEGKWRTAAEGADTVVWLIAAERMSRWQEGKGAAGMQGGEFWLDRKAQRKTLPGAWYKGVDDWKVKNELMRRVKALVDAVEPKPDDVSKFAYLTAAAGAASSTTTKAVAQSGSGDAPAPTSSL